MEPSCTLKYFEDENFSLFICPLKFYSNDEKFPIYGIPLSSKQHQVCVLNLTFAPCQTEVGREPGTLPPGVAPLCRTQPRVWLLQVARS